MKIFVGQIYIKPGVAFPFSLRFQRWLGDALTKRVELSKQFCEEYGADFGLGLRLSAKDDIDQPDIKGPTVFKRDKNVEFTIFLPYRAASDYHERKSSLILLNQMLQSVIRVLEQLRLDATNVLTDSTILETEFLNTPGLMDAPRPAINPRAS